LRRRSPLTTPAIPKAAPRRSPKVDVSATSDASSWRTISWRRGGVKASDATRGARQAAAARWTGSDGTRRVDTTASTMETI